MAMSHNFLINLGFEKVNESHLGHPFSTEDNALNYLQDIFLQKKCVKARVGRYG